MVVTFETGIALLCIRAACIWRCPIECPRRHTGVRVLARRQTDWPAAPGVKERDEADRGRCECLSWPRVVSRSALRPVRGDSGSRVVAFQRSIKASRATRPGKPAAGLASGLLERPLPRLGVWRWRSDGGPAVHGIPQPDWC